jgi:hypothetical protein
MVLDVPNIADCASLPRGVGKPNIVQDCRVSKLAAQLVNFQGTAAVCFKHHFCRGAVSVCQREEKVVSFQNKRIKKQAAARVVPPVLFVAVIVWLLNTSPAAVTNCRTNADQTRFHAALYCTACMLDIKKKALKNLSQDRPSRLNRTLFFVGEMPRALVIRSAGSWELASSCHVVGHRMILRRRPPGHTKTEWPAFGRSTWVIAIN